MLLPIWPPSAPPIVIPGALRNAFSKDVTPCDSSRALLMTVTVWGISRSAVGTFAPTLEMSAWKSCLSDCPVTVTAGSVTPSDDALEDAGGAACAVSCDDACGEVCAMDGAANGIANASVRAVTSG